MKQEEQEEKKKKKEEQEEQEEQEGKKRVGCSVVRATCVASYGVRGQVSDSEENDIVFSA